MWFSQASLSRRRDGSFTNAKGWVQRIHRAVDPPGEARVDWEIIQQLAKLLGGEMDYHLLVRLRWRLQKMYLIIKMPTHQNMGMVESILREDEIG